MKNKILIIIAIVGIILTVNSCDSEENAIPAMVLPANCDTTKLVYNSGPDSVSGIINTQCAVAGCHVPRTAASDFTSYANIYGTGYISGGSYSAMYTCLFNGNPYVMPNIPQPGWAANPCMKAKLLQWLLNGAPN